MFFIGYVLFEVPSNMLLRRYGAHRWLARIMVSWGLVSAGMMFVQTPMQFYIMRFLLGMAEAGFFPGVIFYLTGWFTREHRGRMTAAFMTAIAVAGVVVGPVSGAVLHHFHELGGYAGWQWLFLIEGVPSVLLGLATLYCLPVSPERARWLTPQEAARLNALLQAEREGVDDTPVRQALRGARLWILSGIYACYGMSFFGFVFWLPTIIKSSGVADPLSIGLISAIPWGVAIVAMCGVGAYVDRRQNTRPVLMALSVAAAAGWAASPWVADSVSASMAVLSIAMFGLMASLPVFWNLPTAAYQGASAAVAIAVITSVGNARTGVALHRRLDQDADVAPGRGHVHVRRRLAAGRRAARLPERAARPDAEYHAPPGDAACPPSISCPNCAACSAAMPSCRARRSSNTAMPTGAACRRRRRWRCCGRAIPAGIGRAGHLQQTRPARSDAGRVDGPCGRRLHHGPATSR